MKVKKNLRGADVQRSLSMDDDLSSFSTDDGGDDDSR